MRKILILAAIVAWPLLTAGSCATTAPPEPRIQIVEKAVPVPVPCVGEKTPAAPAYPVQVSELAALSPGQRLVAAVAGMIARDQRLKEVEPVVAACRTLPD